MSHTYKHMNITSKAHKSNEYHYQILDKESLKQKHISLPKILEIFTLNKKDENA